MQLASSVVCLFRVVNALISKGRCSNVCGFQLAISVVNALISKGRCSLPYDNQNGADTLNRGGCSIYPVFLAASWCIDLKNEGGCS